jgi:hypothetical protein
LDTGVRQAGDSLAAAYLTFFIGGIKFTRDMEVAMSEKLVCGFCYENENGKHGEIKKEWFDELKQVIAVCRKHSQDGQDDRIQVVKFVCHSGKEFFSDKSGNAHVRKIVDKLRGDDPCVRVEAVEMTRREYFDIPTTNAAYQLFS